MEGEIPRPQSEELEKAQEQKAQEVLTPELRAMSEARVAILGPLDRVELSAAEKEAVGKYAGKVGELAGQELERLRRESPVRRIVAAMDEYLPEKRGLVVRTRRIQSMAELPERWQAAIKREQGLALLREGRPKSLRETIDWLARPEGYYSESENFPTQKYAFEATGDNQKEALNQLLHRLDVLPEGVSVEDLFERLPANEYSPQAMEQAKSGNVPTRLHSLASEHVVGLKSDQLPGVWFDVVRSPVDLGVSVRFTPEAITRATTDIPGVEQ